MDKRIIKTRISISEAFCELLKVKSYDEIIIQDILEYASIGRSTFYAHFHEKSDLLNSLCESILMQEITVDESEKIIRPVAPSDSQETILSTNETNVFIDKHLELKKLIRSIFENIYNRRAEMLSIFSCDAKITFFELAFQVLAPVFDRSVHYSITTLSHDFIINHLVGCFYEAINWWAKSKLEYNPGNVADQLLYTYMVYFNGLEYSIGSK